MSALDPNGRRVYVTCNNMGLYMAIPVNKRVEKRREALRLAGLRPVQIWVPDTRQEGFVAECRRQASLVAAADAIDADLDAFLQAALGQLDRDGEA
nr:hypothetical protein RNT25_00860 [arsenite-oxidising bacterium NT-25]CAD6605893.1 hypothetical protein RTCK_01731 [Rhizobium sp. TCK]